MAECGNSSSVDFNSCKATTSGFAVRSHLSRFGSRRLTLLMLKVAIFMRIASCRSKSADRHIRTRSQKNLGEDSLNQNLALAVGGRLDRLPFSRTIWYFVLLIALGGVFELYDLFMTAYIAPGLVKSGLFVAKPPSFFAPTGVGFFVFCTFAGMFVGTMGFGFVADRVGRRAIFTYSLVWYSLASTIMAFQNSAEGVDLWRFIASVGIGLEQVTIDTFIPELV